MTAKSSLMLLRRPKWLLVFLGVMIWIRAAAISESDTSYVYQLLRHGRQIHHSNQDSALYYYRLITEDERVASIQQAPGAAKLDKAFLIAVIRAHNYTGDIYYYDDEYNRAETHYQLSLDIARRTGLDEYTADALYNVGYIKYVTNNFALAIEMFEESYKLFAKSENKQGMYDVTQACALALRHLGDLEKSDSCYHKAFILAREIGDSLQVADVEMNNGILLCEEGNLEEGTKFFNNALRYYENHGEDEATSQALLNIGVVMKMIGEYEKAEYYMKKSAELTETMQKKSQLVIHYYNLADLYMEMGKLETAHEYCLKTLSVASEIGAQPFVGECNLLLGKYYYKEGEYSKAEPYFREAAGQIQSSNDRPLMTNLLLWRSRNSLAAGHTADAIAQASEAVRLSDNLQLLMNRKDAALVLSAAYEKAGNLSSSLSWFKQYQMFSDSLNYYNQHKEISRIEAKYNFEKKEKENELLRNKATLQEQELRNRNFLMIALVFIVTLSIVVIILLVHRSRDAKLLFEQQQMLNLKHLEELEHELDGKNRELTSKMMFLNQKNDLISRLINRLQEIRDTDENSSDEILSIVNELRTDAPQSSWKEFETQFIQVHPGFYQRLYEKHPELTSYEQRLCAFLRMNLNTKEIASISGRSAKSIEVTRSRIRTKLQLKRDENLSSFLAAV
jgi:tetratricopeptide (TPR) repeat protein